jgi:hypothetical protein
MDSNPQETGVQISKTSVWKKLFSIILLIIPTITLIYSGGRNIATTMETSEMAYQQLLEQQREVMELTQNLLYYSVVLEVGEKLTKTDWKDMSSTLRALIINHPEIILICSINGNGGFNTHYYEGDKIDKKESLLNVIDFLPDCYHILIDTVEYSVKEKEFEKEPVINAYSHDKHLIASYGYYKACISEFIITSDIDKLKERMPIIFNNLQSRLPAFGKYFLESNKTHAQVRFYDQTGKNFYNIGNPDSTGWDVIQKQHVGFLPWEIKVQIFPRQSELLEQASLRGKVPWEEIIPNLIGVIGIILLALQIKQYWLGEKQRL